MQMDLNWLGYPLIEDGKFGCKTSCALKRFQADQKLVVDGVCGEHTFAALVHADTKKIQSKLNEAGYHLVVDGMFGPLTKASVKQFQKDKCLVVDGWVGDKTRAALNGRCIEKLQEGLNWIGADPQLVVDGIFGHKTENAVVNF